MGGKAGPAKKKTNLNGKNASLFDTPHPPGGRPWGPRFNQLEAIDPACLPQASLTEAGLSTAAKACLMLTGRRKRLFPN